MKIPRSVLLSFGLLAILSLGADDLPEILELKAKAADAKLTVPARARAVYEATTALDRLANDARDPQRQRAYWSDAISLIDKFAAENPNYEDLSKLRFADSVYHWALGRNWLREFDRTSEETAQERAAEEFKAAVQILNPIADQVKASPEPFAQNVRYRLAQTLAEIARLETDPGTQRPLRERANDLLATPTTEPQLAGFALLLKSEVSTDLGLHQQALEALDQAGKQNPRPSADSLATVRVKILKNQGRFPEAIKNLEAEPIPDAVKDSLAIEVLLGRLRQERGTERRPIEAEIFARARKLRGKPAAEARRALTLLSRDLAEPEPGLPADCWEILAEGFALLGRPGRAAVIVARGADRVESEAGGQTGDKLRYQAGAYHFQAGEFFEAAEILGKVVRSKTAGDLRPKAGLLRILSDGRALAQKDSRVTTAMYRSALEEQVKEFPEHPVSQEAYWLLGRLRDVDGKPDEADSLFLKIQHGHTRWLAATATLATHQLEAIEAQEINGDRPKIEALLKDARGLLADRAKLAQAGSEALEIQWLLARLELALDIGKPADALIMLDAAAKLAGTPAQFDRVKQLRFVALARLNRWPEAEIVAKDVLPRTNLADALEIARLLDRAGASAETDLVRRRLGYLLRGWTQSFVDRSRDFNPADRDEIVLRAARAALFAGDTVAARRWLGELGERALEGTDRHLRDMADAYSRMGAFSYAVDIHRVRARKLKPGSLSWLDARLSLALGYYRGGQPGDARQIIDATAILHPELGGHELKDRFERLRRRLEDEAKGTP